jgi:predicted MFS family arabinose efflux permease
MLGTLAFGWGSTVYNITQVSLRQALTPERLQGRMNASMRWIVWGTIPLGGLFGGVLATAYGLRSALWVGAIGGAFTFLPVLLSSVRSIEEMPEPVDPPSTRQAEAAGGVLEPTTSPLAADAAN